MCDCNASPKKTPGNAKSGAIKIDEKGVRLPDAHARFVQLSLHNIEDNPQMPFKTGAAGGDFSFEDENEIYYGFGGVYAHQLFPAHTTGLLPVGNAGDVCLRARPGKTATVWYSIFW